MASPNCTPDCATLGHSDQCWNQTVPRRPRSTLACVYSQQPIHKPISLYANRSMGYHGHTPVVNNEKTSTENYGNTAFNNTFPRNTGTNACQVTDAHQNGFHTGPTGRGISTKHRPNNAHSIASNSDHANSKHYRNNTTPLILSPITEDPMEITDSKASVPSNDINADYEYHHGNTDQVYPITSLIRHKNGSVYAKYDINGHRNSYPSGHDTTDMDLGYRSDLTGDITPDYYSS